MLYDTLDALGYPVSRSFIRLETGVSVNDIYVLIEPNYLYFTDEDFDNTLEWVFRGGRLIILESAEFSVTDYWLSYSIDDPGVTSHGYTLYSYGLGEIITGDADMLLNKPLMENSKYGAEFSELLERWNISNICFSESIHGFINTGNAWYRTPEVLKILTYQLIIIAALIIWHFGKRFGKPVPYYEEAEREENEHIKALANIYHKARASEVVTINYHRRFIERCSHAFHVNETYMGDNLYELWREASLPHLDLLAKVLAEDTRKLSAKQLRHHIKNIQTCEKALRLKGDKYAGRLHTDSSTAH